MALEIKGCMRGNDESSDAVAGYNLLEIPGSLSYQKAEMRRVGSLSCVLGRLSIRQKGDEKSAPASVKILFIIRLPFSEVASRGEG